MITQPQSFSFQTILDAAASTNEASDVATACAHTALLRCVLAQPAPLWLVFCHPDRPTNDSRRLTDALRTLFAQSASSALTDGATVLDDTIMPPAHHEARQASQTDETRLILDLIEARPRAESARPHADVPLVGLATAQTPLWQRWASLGLEAASHSALAPARAGPGAEVVSITLELWRRSPSWYTALLRPVSERVLEALLATVAQALPSATDASTSPGLAASRVLLERWYMHGERGLLSARSELTLPLCFVLVSDAALPRSRFSEETCTVAVQQACLDVRRVQKAALEAAASQVVDRRVPLSLPAIEHAEPRKRARALDEKEEGEHASTTRVTADGSLAPLSGLFGWATRLRADAAASAEACPSATTESSKVSVHSPRQDRREAWIHEVMAAMPSDIGGLLLLPDDGPDVSSQPTAVRPRPLGLSAMGSASALVTASHSTLGEQLQRALSLNANLSTLLLIR